MINNVVLVGRLTKDPELKMTPSGIAVARFTLAVNRPFTGQDGEKKADFVNCIAWRKQAENLANYMRKGGQIGVTGRIETGSYEGQDGKRVYTTDVVADNIQFLEPKNNSGNNDNAPPQQQAPNAYGNNAYNAPSQSYRQPPPQQQMNHQQNLPPQPHTNLNNDPFSNNNAGSVDISEDDLPF